MNTYVISLKSATDRRSTLEERLAKGNIYDFEIFDATPPHEHLEEDIYSLTKRTWKKDNRLKNERKNDARMACYISHLSLLKHLLENGINECLILEDDIVFTRDITDVLYKQPKDCFCLFLDTTHIESLQGDHFIPNWVGENLRLDNNSGIRAWCAGAYWCNNIEKLYYNLLVNDPKLYDKCLIDYIHKEHTCYLYFPADRLCYQDRNTFESSIK